ncbi:MAG: ATP-binding cassette domain-containing protein [Shimia sp.]
MTDHPALSADGLSIGSGDTTIVQDVLPAITPGAITVLVGPNGCGKSTLLKAFARILPAKAGHVTLGGAGRSRRFRRRRSRG